LLWQVTGDTSGPAVGPSFVSILDSARKHKKEYRDEFISVEHLLRAFTADKRFGQQLFKDLNIGESELKEAISAVRGSQRVTDQSMSKGCHSHFAYYSLLYSFPTTIASVLFSISLYVL
jgi:ATP-dependent Clp protease ATP-binding subunit ClpA